MHDLGLLLVLAIIGLIWWNTLGARTRARRAARNACKQVDVRFIDELAFQRVRLVRDRQNLVAIIRTYGFEFFVLGDRRYGGQVTMRGHRVDEIRMDPHPFTADDCG